MSRYKNVPIVPNSLPLYKKARKMRGIPDTIAQYRLHRQPKPTVEDIANINTIGYIWKTGDRLYKLAETHYNDPKLWWIIAWFNDKPTEAHFKVGDVIQIPTPIERVYGLLRM